MNTVHDFGGMQNFGPVVPEPNEPPFHHEWERRVFGMTLAVGALRLWSLDQSRAARESLPPAQYLSSSYYEIWLEGLLKLMEQHKPAQTPARLTADRVASMLATRRASTREATRAALFKAGDAVRTKNLHPRTHTRLPRYCRDKPGTIERLHGVHVFPDANATGSGEQPQWVYTVRFEAKDLWGADTTASAVYVDCFEPYLEPR
jgi:hypothetical protein